MADDSFVPVNPMMLQQGARSRSIRGADTQAPARWWRGVEGRAKDLSDVASPSAWANAIRTLPDPALGSGAPISDEEQQQAIGKAMDTALSIGPGELGAIGAGIIKGVGKKAAALIPEELSAAEGAAAKARAKARAKEIPASKVGEPLQTYTSSGEPTAPAPPPPPRGQRPFAKTADVEDVPFTEVPAPEVPTPVAIETSKARSKTLRGKKKKAVGTIFDEIDDVDVAKKMAMNDAHIKRDPSGKYIGAPDWVTSPGSLRKMRADALDKVKEGVENADWYDRQRALAESLSDDPAMQSLFARGTAAYSPQAMPKVELPTFLKQHNAEVLTGEPVQARTLPQMRNVARAYEMDPVTGDVVDVHPDLIRLGKKTEPYAEAKDPTVDEGTLYKTANDIWHGRVMGYGKNFSRGFTPQEHGFLTGENLRLAQAAEDAGLPITTPRQAQASTWLTTRVESEAAKDAKRFAAQSRARARYERDPEKWRGAKQNRLPEKLEPDFIGPPALSDKSKTPPPVPKPVRTDEELRAFGTQGLDTARARSEFNLTNEGVGRARHLTGIGDLPPEVLRQHAEDIRAAEGADSTGRDPVTHALRMYSTKTVPTTGAYESQETKQIGTTPGWSSAQMVSNVGDSGTGIRTTPIDMEAMRAAARTGAYFRAQEAGGGNRFLDASMSPKVGAMNAARIHDATPQELAALIKAGLTPVDVGHGVHHVTRFDPGPVVGSWRDVQQIVPRAERGTMETVYEPGIPEEEGTGVATNALRDFYNQSPIRNLAERVSYAGPARRYGAVEGALAKQRGLTEAPDVKKAREIAAKTGNMRGFFDWIDKHGGAAKLGLPAVLMSLGLSQALREPQGRRPETMDSQ